MTPCKICGILIESKDRNICVSCLKWGNDQLYNQSINHVRKSLGDSFGKAGVSYKHADTEFNSLVAYQSDLSD